MKFQSLIYSPPKEKIAQTWLRTILTNPLKGYKRPLGHINQKKSIETRTAAAHYLILFPRGASLLPGTEKNVIARKKTFAHIVCRTPGLQDPVFARWVWEKKGRIDRDVYYRLRTRRRTNRWFGGWRCGDEDEKGQARKGCAQGKTMGGTGFLCLRGERISASRPLWVYNCDCLIMRVEMPSLVSADAVRLGGLVFSSDASEEWSRLAHTEHWGLTGEKLGFFND